MGLCRICSHPCEEDSTEGLKQLGYGGTCAHKDCVTKAQSTIRHSIVKTQEPLDRVAEFVALALEYLKQRKHPYKPVVEYLEMALQEVQDHKGQ